MMLELYLHISKQQFISFLGSQTVIPNNNNFYCSSPSAMVKSYNQSQPALPQIALMHSSSVQNTEDWLEQDSFQQSHHPSSRMITELHSICRSKKKLIDKVRQRATEILKICRACDKWNNTKSIITCSRCEDHYHIACYKSDLATHSHRPFVCVSCQTNGKPQKSCQACRKDIAKKSKITECPSCRYQYHSECIHKKMKVCKRCVKISNLLPTNKRRKSNEDEGNNPKQPKINEIFNIIATKSKAQSNQNNQFLLNRQGRSFFALNLLDKDDHTSIQKYKNQLLHAIQSKQMNYTENLIDIDEHLMRMQGKSLDFGLSNMSKSQEKEYLQYKEQPIGPFSLRLLKDKGYDVVAKQNIPKRAIICEYVGEVMTLRQCVQLQKQSLTHNDSIMTLWTGRNSDQKLLICPEKWTNIARFLNGVGKEQKHRNVCSERMCFRGKPIVLLLAQRNIKKGESLCYDYNGDETNQAEYDTTNFK